ncbi:hypothetical protein Anas_00301 [Armadillidium nasatum]|uniref:Uncharacterized protein n=1 Tax=Armadillidium nasatum TaxID=96803 RepID=A0A5N5TGE9_9CRUS|nr:hypothetical protein Anas_00301 [Armadillidium nasatum]
MDRKMNELFSLYSETEREISNLETEFNHVELKKKKLQQLTACHIAKICPQYSKRQKIYRENIYESRGIMQRYFRIFIRDKPFFIRGTGSKIGEKMGGRRKSW